MKEVIAVGGSAADQNNWNQLNDTLAQFPGVVERVVNKAVKPSAAPIYQTRMLNIPPGVPVQLFDYNSARTRFFITVITPQAAVYIGDRSSLNADGIDGYYVGEGPALMEMRTIAPVYIVTAGTDAVAVSVWAEYEAE